MTKKFAALVKILLIILALLTPVLLFEGFARERSLLQYRSEIIASHEEERRRIVGDVALRYFSESTLLRSASLSRKLPKGPIEGLSDFPPPDQVLAWGGISAGEETRGDRQLLQLLYDEDTFPSGMPKRFAALVELYRQGNVVLGHADFGRFYQVASSFWRAEGLEEKTYAFLLRKMPLEARCRFEEQMRFLGMDLPEAEDGILIRLTTGQMAYLLAPSAKELNELNGRLQAFSPGTRLVPQSHWRNFDQVDMTLQTQLSSVNTPIKQVAMRYLLTGTGIELVLLLIYLVITRYEKVNRMQKRLMATTSHELRTPLAVIRQFAEMLMDREEQVPGRIHKYHGHIHRESIKMQFLVENLLSASRVENLKMTPSFEAIDLAPWIGELTDGAARLHENKVRLECPPLTVYWDRTLMSQVLTNVMENARVHAETDMDLTIARDDNKVRITCRDYGQAPDLKQLARIRAFKTGGKRGLGLGLFLIKRILKLHGGRMLFSDAQPGLRVEIELPVDCRKDKNMDQHKGEQS